MKNRKGTLVWLFASVAFVGVARAETAYYTGSEDGPGASSLTNRTHWSDSANWTAGVTDSSKGYRTGVWQPDPNTDYAVLNGGVRPPRFNDYRFIGKSLQVGDAAAGKTCAVGVGTSVADAVQVLDFSQSKIICSRGSFGQYYHTATRILGPVEIIAPPNASGNPLFSFGANHCMNGLGPIYNDGAALEFAGKVSGAKGTMFAVHISNYNSAYDNVSATNTIIRFTGDLSELYSTVIVRPYANRQFEWPDDRRATFSTTCATMPGKIELWRGGAIQLFSAAQSFTLDSLEICGDNRIEVPYDFTSGKGASLIVTNALSVTGRNKVNLAVTGTDPGTAFEHVVLKAPDGVTLDVANFVLDSVPRMPYALRVTTDETDGRSCLVLRHGPVVLLGQNDGSKTRESFFKSDNPHGWTGVDAAEWPVAGKDYVVTNLTLRGPTTADQVFGGDTLTLRGSSYANATLSHRASKSATINDLRIDAAYANGVTISHYYKSTEYVTVWPFAERGVCQLNGKALVSSKTNLNGCVNFTLANGRGFKYAMELSGDATVCYNSSVEKEAYLPISHHWLTVANSNLTGRVILNYNIHGSYSRSSYKFDWVPEAGITLPNWDYPTRVYIDDPAVFGGREPYFTFDALAITDYTVLHPTRSMTFDDATRGIRIAKLLSTKAVPVARFDVTNDVTLTICQKINFTSEKATLVKEGAGTLVFGAGCSPTFDDTQKLDPYVNSNNLFRVLAGTFKPTAHGVCDGLQVSFAADAVLALDAAATDADLLRYGLYNNRYRSGRTDRTGTAVYPGLPLSLESGAETYRIRIDGDAASKPPRKMGLVTVGAEYADAIRGRLTLTHPFAAYQANLVETTFDAPSLGGQLVTFSVEFQKGLALFVR